MAGWPLLSIVIHIRQETVCVELYNVISPATALAIVTRHYDSHPSLAYHHQLQLYLNSYCSFILC